MGGVQGCRQRIWRSGSQNPRLVLAQCCVQGNLYSGAGQGCGVLRARYFRLTPHVIISSPAWEEAAS